MYVPKAFTVEDAEHVAAMIDAADVVHLVTPTAAGLVATTLPMLLDRSPGEHGSLIGHVARANPQWREFDAEAEVMAIVAGPDAYVSPSWYPAKREHGRVVPTWNYTSVHVYGRLVVRDEPAWKLDLVRRLTERHERRFEEPWSVEDAPADFVERMLGAIIGLELQITRVDAKRKLSQNRDQPDIDNVITALATGTERERAVAAEMRKG